MVGEVSVPRRRLRQCVTEQLANDVERLAAGHQVRREFMAAMPNAA
jgi:hypothetical protein